MATPHGYTTGAGPNKIATSAGTARGRRNAANTTQQSPGALLHVPFCITVAFHVQFFVSAITQVIPTT
eukprot:9481055-Pyramimonas_sp.AAC.1